jgi:hypothetical protein
MGGDWERVLSAPQEKVLDDRVQAHGDGDGVRRARVSEKIFVAATSRGSCGRVCVIGSDCWP